MKSAIARMSLILVLAVIRAISVIRGLFQKSINFIRITL